MVAGHSSNGSNGDFALVRYNADGSLDTRFNLANTLDGAPSFTEDGAPVVLDANVAIYDAEMHAAGSYDGASLTLARHNGANAEDTYSAKVGSGLSALAEGGNLVLSGVIIGTVTQNSAGTLILTFNADATEARVNAAMQAVAYANASDTSVRVGADRLVVLGRQQRRPRRRRGAGRDRFHDHRHHRGE